MILLGNYNYYPFHSGGSEVYVSGLARFLESQGEEVRIIASIPKESHPAVFTGKCLQIAFYSYCGNQIAGVWLKSESTRQIYAKYDKAHVSDWVDFFRQFPDWIPDLFHLHGYTGAINTAIPEALKSLKPGLPFYFSYHTPVSCPKGTLYRFNREACTVIPDQSVCTACLLNQNASLSAALATVSARFMPALSSPGLPALLRMKSLTGDELNSFQRLVLLADHWFVFSDYILERVKTSGVIEGKITRIRHGISNLFLLKKGQINRTDSPVKFVFMGRMEKIKGVLTLINAWMNLPESNERKLQLIGMIRPETPKMVKNGIEKLSRRNDVEVLNSIQREELPGILDQAHCLIIPSEWIEIGPLVFHEAIARGMNVIASDIGGTEELSRFYGSGCTTFRTGNTTDLKTKIESFKFEKINHTVQGETEHYAGVFALYPRKESK